MTVEASNSSGLWPGPLDLWDSDLFTWFRTLGIRNDPRIERLLIDLVMRYAAHECGFLASAVARNAGRPASVVIFERTTGREEHSHLHSVLVLAAQPDLVGGIGLDILGRAPIARTEAGLAVLGPLRSRVTAPIARTDFTASGEETCLAVAGCLPWMNHLMPARFRIPDSMAFPCLMDLSERATPAGREPD